MKINFGLLKKKAGMTLAEVLIALFVSSILIGCAIGMLPTVKRLMNSITINSHMDAMCDTANEYVRAVVQSSNAVTVRAIGVDDDGISGLVEDYKSDGKHTTGTIVIRTNADGNLRIYDMGNAPGSSVVSFVKAAAPSDAEEKMYALFNEAYYENTNFTLTFKSTGGQGSIISQCIIREDATTGEKIINQPRTLNFRLLNGATLPTVSDTDDTLVETRGIVIVCQVNDYDALLTPASP